MNFKNRVALFIAVFIALFPFSNSSARYNNFYIQQQSYSNTQMIQQQKMRQQQMLQQQMRPNSPQ